MNSANVETYHIHVYFKDLHDRRRAQELRDALAERFPVQLGRWHDRLVGPHALPMYQVAFAAAVFPVLVPWLMLNRQDLTILLHPNTRNPRRDHLVHAVWMGSILPIMHPEQLPEEQPDAG